MMSSDLVLVESATLRAEYANHTDALTKVKPFRMIPGTQYATTEMLAEDFDVPIPTIRALAVRHADELKTNGRTVANRDDLRKLGLSDKMKLSRASEFALYPPRATLNVAMLLTDSEIARDVRHLILNDVFISRDVLEGFALYNRNNIIASRSYWAQHGSQHESGRLAHTPGRTYVVLRAPGVVKIGHSAGMTRGKNVIESVVGRLAQVGEYKPLLKVIPGGFSRECELFVKLEDYRTDDGVDLFRLTDESLTFIMAYRPSFDASKIERAYNRKVISQRPEIEAA